MASEASAKKLESAARTIAESRPQHCSVLLIESDPDLQWSLARMLTVNGNRVVSKSIFIRPGGQQLIASNKSIHPTVRSVFRVSLLLLTS